MIVGLEGDYYFGGRTSKDPRYLVPEGCSAGVMQTGNFGCGSAASFGSFQTRGHIRGIAGWEFTPRFMGFVAGGAGELARRHSGRRVIADTLLPTGSISSTYGGDLVRLFLGRRRAGQAQ
jgi:hypothetical protein